LALWVKTCRAGDRLARQLYPRHRTRRQTVAVAVQGHERHSAYPQPSEGRSSHYEATGDYLNSRCVYYKEEPKPATYGAP
jgi:hypothetical protein